MNFGVCSYRIAGGRSRNFAGRYSKNDVHEDVAGIDRAVDLTNMHALPVIGEKL